VETTLWWWTCTRQIHVQAVCRDTPSSAAFRTALLLPQPDVLVFKHHCGFAKLLHLVLQVLHLSDKVLILFTVTVGHTVCERTGGRGAGANTGPTPNTRTKNKKQTRQPAQHVHNTGVHPLLHAAFVCLLDLSQQRTERRVALDDGLKQVREYPKALHGQTRGAVFASTTSHVKAFETLLQRDFKVQGFGAEEQRL